MNTRIALVGDFDSAEIAHRAIEACFELPSMLPQAGVARRWVPTEHLHPGEAGPLAEAAGIWLVPASPYRNTAGALWACEFARAGRIPFLGTCGGFQHLLLEYVRNVLGQQEAEHAELSPDSPFPLLSRLTCPLVERSERVLAVGGDHFRRAFGPAPREEDFHCSYGLNPSYERLLANSALAVVARSETGEVRAVELSGHPFYVGTLFQPERRALRGDLHPIVHAFFAASLRVSLWNPPGES